jgi:uncharacterized membrane protein
MAVSSPENTFSFKMLSNASIHQGAGVMEKGRLEAFSDAVIAIVMTIMVLELKVPHEATWSALRPLVPVFFSYAISFLMIGIYWNNHHHLLQATQYVNGRVLWANLHLLFWMSLIPFVTGWTGENNFAALPVAFYGVVLLFSGIAYFVLTKTLVANHGQDSVLAIAMGKDIKGKISLLIYAAGIGVAFINPWIAFMLYILVAIIWLIPDRRIERTLKP